MIAVLDHVSSGVFSFIFICYFRNNKAVTLPRRATDTARRAVMESYGGPGSKPGKYMCFVSKI